MLHEINTSFILILHITFIYILIKVMSTSTDGIINFNILQKKNNKQLLQFTIYKDVVLCNNVNHRCVDGKLMTLQKNVLEFTCGYSKSRYNYTYFQ